MMKVSVIIPTYNEDKTIKECIESLLKQNYGDFEIIVVDDGSTDTSPLVLAGISKAYGVRVFEQKHLGAGEARNFGATHAKGEILVFVDADMTFEKVFVRKLIAPIVSGMAIGSFSKEEYVSNWANIWARCWSWNLGLRGRKRLPDNYPDTQKVFRAITKSAFKRAGGFSKGGYTDDWSLSEKLRVMAVCAPGARFYHKNPDSLSEVFNQSKWVYKRDYKFGVIGLLVTIVRNSIFTGLIVGTYKSVLHKDPRFLIFKLVFSFGATVGALSYAVTRKGEK